MGVVAAMCAAALILAGTNSAQAIINLRFTPSELVRSSSEIFVVELSTPGSNSVEGKVTEALQGKPPADKVMKFSFAEAKELTREEVAGAFGTNQTALAIVRISSQQADQAEGQPAGAMQINTLWYAVYKKATTWSLDKDNQTLFAVCAGTSRMLAVATRYVLNDPTARFPVQSDIMWEKDLNLGKIAGTVRGCVPADIAGAIGAGVVVLSDGGDRFIQSGAKGAMPVDITDKVKLSTASRLAAPGDFDGDGRMDLLSWDGKGSSPGNNTYATGELDFHGNQHRPAIVGCSSADINSDGRQGAAVFYLDKNPLVFFNRGFACFGWARELDLKGEGAAGVPMQAPGDEPRPKLKATEALQRTREAGAVLDMNGDCVQDMVAVDGRSEAWVLVGGTQGRRMLGMTVVAPKARGPVTITVSDPRRRTGMYVAKPGVPVFVGYAQPGTVKIEWMNAEGKSMTQKVIVVNPARVELAMCEPSQAWRQPRMPPREVARPAASLKGVFA